jgi:biopolymer transport protein ExbB
MMTTLFRYTIGALLALSVVMNVMPLRAQQRPGVAPQQTQQVQPTPSPFPPAPVPAQPAAVPAVAAQPAPAPVETPVAAEDSGAHQLPPVRAERDMSPWTMFMAADILVKAVMISLAFASLVTWTIFLGKTVQLALAKKRLTGALEQISKARTLSEAQVALGAKTGVLAAFLSAAIQELRMSADSIVESGIKERVASSLLEITRVEARSMRQGMATLATIGSTAPFVGLFGTVWGIMNSFIGISKAQTTNLAVVAPGIAEALLATAIGLIAAIPAVMIYNHFSRTTKGYVDLVSRGSGQVGRLLSRDLDRAERRMLGRAAE